MDLSLPMLLIVRLVLTLTVLFYGQYRRWPLELTLCGTSLVLALLYGIMPWEWAGIALDGCLDLSLMALLCVLAAIMGLSGLMEKTGQTQRLMDEIRARITSPKLRLAFFPALIGLLPVPGGAIFSCPMVKELSGDMNVTNEYRARLNAWFRHIWECVWPLFPGYVLLCALTDLTPPVITLHCLPIWAAAILGGWWAFLRDLPPDAAPGRPLVPHSSWKSALREGLPIILGLASSFLLHALLPDIPAGFSFAMGFAAGILTCLLQNRTSPVQLGRILYSPKTCGILRMVIGIFIFKSVIVHCGLIADIGALVQGSRTVLFFACIVLPLLGGMFTGIQIGLVGMCFPILIPLIQQAGLWDERIPWVILAEMFGYIGQMLSPVHVCLVVTSRYFDVTLGSLLKGMLFPCIILSVTAVVCFFIYL